MIEDAVAEDRNGPHRIVWREAVRELKENIVAMREQALEALAPWRAGGSGIALSGRDGGVGTGAVAHVHRRDGDVEAQRPRLRGKQATSEQAWKRIATSSRTSVSRGGRVASACAIN